MSIIGLEIPEDECPVCGSQENEITPDGQCSDCWMDEHMGI